MNFAEKNNELELNKPKQIGKISRRDVLKTAWTVPVVLAVAPPTNVVAGSDPGDPGDQGLSEGFWSRPKHHQYWTDYTPDQNYQEVFFQNQASPISVIPTTQSLGQVVKDSGAKIMEIQMARSATAALLNAAHPDINYPLTPQQIFNKVKAAYEAAEADPTKRREIFEALKDEFNAYNNLHNVEIK